VEEGIAFRDAWMVCAASGVISALAAFMPLRYAPWAPPTLYWLIPLGIWALSAHRKRAAARKAAA
jgi:hypothetical protein